MCLSTYTLDRNRIVKSGLIVGRAGGEGGAHIKQGNNACVSTAAGAKVRVPSLYTNCLTTDFELFHLLFHSRMLLSTLGQQQQQR